jgi:hypothetical protein
MISFTLLLIFAFLHGCYMAEKKIPLLSWEYWLTYLAIALPYLAAKLEK